MQVSFLALNTFDQQKKLCGYSVIKECFDLGVLETYKGQETKVL